MPGTVHSPIREISLAPPPTRFLDSSHLMLSWNEIRHRSIKFSRDWKGTTSEKSERQTF